MWFASDKNAAGLDFSDGVWRKGSLIVVPDAGDLRQKCLSLHHDTLFAGHWGVIVLCSWCYRHSGGRALTRTCDIMCLLVITASITKHPMKACRTFASTACA